MLECGICAWTAALISCLAFGTFAVPIKSPAAQSVNVDPLVFQSYKTFMCFLTSWIVLLFGEPFFYTPWGIVSGLFWVPAGVAAIYAVQNAGLAVSQGLWSSIIVLVSFVWGVFIFEEEVKSKFTASFAIILMVVGLWGMSFYSSPETFEIILDEEEDDDDDNDDADDDRVEKGADSSSNLGKSKENYRCWDDGDISTQATRDLSIDGTQMTSLGGDLNIQTVKSDTELLSLGIGERSGYSSSNDSNLSVDGTDPQIEGTSQIFYSRKCGGPSRRQLGLAAAVFNGLWGGSVMVPMHYAPEEVRGATFVISFAIGASLITILLWIIRYFYLLKETNMSYSLAFQLLPSLHLKVMFIPGGIAGSLWSLGNFCSMISVQNLGEGVGYSLTQASMLVSGLWGIFYFQEVRGTIQRLKWLTAALITLVGILILSSQV